MESSTQVSHEVQVIGSLRERLAETYAGRRTPQEVTETVERVFHQFDHAPIRDFIPLLVEHHARDLLGRA